MRSNSQSLATLPSLSELKHAMINILFLLPLSTFANVGEVVEIHQILKRESTTLLAAFHDLDLELEYVLP